MFTSSLFDGVKVLLDTTAFAKNVASPRQNWPLAAAVVTDVLHPMQMFELPVVMFCPARKPTPMLFCPVASCIELGPNAQFPVPDNIDDSAPGPIAVLYDPVVFNGSAAYPIAVLYDPVVFAINVEFPTAVFPAPVDKLRAWFPTAVLRLPSIFEYSDR